MIVFLLWALGPTPSAYHASLSLGALRPATVPYPGYLLNRVKTSVSISDTRIDVPSGT